MASEASENLGAWTRQVLTYSALTLSLTVLFKYLLSSRAPKNIPPVPVRPYPILGHLPYLKKGMRKQIEEWKNSTGEIFSLYFASKLVVVLSSYDMIYQGYVKNGETLSDRPASMSTNAVGEDPNRGIMLSQGPLWKEQRTVSLHILKAFGMGKNILALKINEEVSVYLNALSELSDPASGLRLLTKTAISNILCSILVGQRFEYGDPFYVNFMDKSEELMRLSQNSSLFTLFPWLRHLPGDLFNAKKRIQTYRSLMDSFCYHYIEKTKNDDSTFDNENFISAYLREKKRLETKGQNTTLDEGNLAKCMFHLLLAGVDTTTTTIQWFMLYMLHHPDVQSKIFAEISDVVGTERAPNMHDKIKLNYTVASIMEAQRMSIFIFSVPHASSADTVINGYTIPAGTTVLANFDSFLLSEDIYKDPKEFRPERFIDAQGNLTQPEQFQPFGLGRRACPGEALAKMELYLFLSALIQRFELRPAVPDELPTLDPIESTVLFPKPFQIKFVDRRRV
ncbi:hypothetical protein RRG08_065947 [Elysia crispata]|uniref:Cytochrome P450 n=1 Tax=Elysia crispata TaxID=231223 RepID=A0AAE0ZFT2_9GAST|nr:hypothetical protein RRG08_065947 [Elysia crispata]